MKLYYANGSGLGHLTRTLAVIHTLQLNQEPILLFTASDHTDCLRLPKNVEIVKIPAYFANNQRSYQNWLCEQIEFHQISEVYIDAFPCGIVGEWNNFPDYIKVDFYHIGRVLNWQNYERLEINRPPSFKATYLLENVDPKHKRFLQIHSQELITLDLSYPPAALNRKERELVNTIFSISDKPIWLIVHSEPQEEVKQLCAYAIEISQIENVQPYFVIISQTKPFRSITSNILWMNLYPAFPMFDKADRIFSACGFNVMQQTEMYKEKHMFLPFQRHYDNQFLRAKKRNFEQKRRKSIEPPE
ncbi:hypothetical protein [uncultured Microscilla sp.]|uniref:hypothetical protein n=1 Tax=uncultured Microscilla sp. TaxID=432653 RepID=UPI00261F7E16|nr:hypothetical protein [uncultured Microscilla sp.]